jgi:hypothetical protein
MSIPIVRYNGRYYIDYEPEPYHPWDPDDGPDPQEMVDSIPTDEKGYRGKVPQKPFQSSRLTVMYRVA